MLRLAVPNTVVMLVQASIGFVEVYFIGKLGTDALAGVAMTLPLFMLMHMMSSGAMGGGISSAIARALGGQRRTDADGLALHALVIGVSFGAVFMVAMLAGGRWIYSTMGASGPSLDAALAYSDIFFSGVILMWLFNSLANVIRGTGNMAVPAAVTCIGAALLVPLSACLILGCGPFPGLGVAGGAVAMLLYYGAGSAAFAWYLWTGRSVVRPSLHGGGYRWPLFRDILRVGAVAVLVSFQTNLTIAIATGLVGQLGPAAVAGYGTAVRLEYLLVPLAFGFGAPLVALVGTCMGAGDPRRALKAAWIGSGIAAVLTEAVGLWAAAFPHAWLTLFDSDPAMLEAGSLYLRTVGPFYGLFGFGMALYFASQGAGALKWPLLANFARLLIAAGLGWLALHSTGELTYVFLAQSAALTAFGLINAVAVARGSWFPQRSGPSG